MTALLWLGAVLLGYAARAAQDRYLQRRRERALQALSGELPDWEKRARELEDYADRNEIDGDPKKRKGGP